VVVDRHVVEDAAAPPRQDRHGRVADRTYGVRAGPRSVGAEELIPALTARGPARERHAAELAARGCRGRVVAAGDAEPLPLAVGAAELLAGLTGRRALGVVRALVGAGVLRRRVLHPEREKGAAEHRDQRESAFHGEILLSWIPKDDDNKRRASRSARDRRRESSDLRRFDVTFFREAVEVAPPGREPRIRARDRIHGAGWDRKRPDTRGPWSVPLECRDFLVQTGLCASMTCRCWSDSDAHRASS